MTRLQLVLALAATGISAAQLVADTGWQPAPNDLDAFMAKVLDRRAAVRKALNDYVLDEVEIADVLGPKRVPLYRARHEFTWYVREGIHVRSPLRYNGVEIAEEERRKYENRWFEREQRRRERRASREATRPDPADSEAPPTPTGALAAPLSEPRFVSEAYFLEFKIEPGNYFLAGRETLEGKEVLRIEYYPTRLFEDSEWREHAERGGAPPTGQRKAGEMARQMNKTALVTLWVDPGEHQIVKYEFENVWLDFLPLAWIVRVDSLKASMAMSQAFKGVWLPRTIQISAEATMADGSYEVMYSRAFSDYREADVTSRIRVPPPERR
jgi:hypothetical protein